MESQRCLSTARMIGICTHTHVNTRRVELVTCSGRHTHTHTNMPNPAVFSEGWFGHTQPWVQWPLVVPTTPSPATQVHINKLADLFMWRDQIKHAPNMSGTLNGMRCNLIPLLLVCVSTTPRAAARWDCWLKGQILPPVLLADSVCHL